MDFLSSLLAGVGGFFAGFIGHVTAHDFCAVIPKWSERLISRAAKGLAPPDRERYREEWLADLAERETVLAKLKHAVGCLVCARKMRSQSIPVLVGTSVRLEFVGSGAVELNGHSALFMFEMVGIGYRFNTCAAKLPRWTQVLLKHAGKRLMRGVALWRLRRKDGQYLQLEQIHRSLGWLVSPETTKVRAFINGKLVIHRAKNPSS